MSTTRALAFFTSAISISALLSFASRNDAAAVDCNNLLTSSNCCPNFPSTECGIGVPCEHDVITNEPIYYQGFDDEGWFIATWKSDPACLCFVIKMKCLLGECVFDMNFTRWCSSLQDANTHPMDCP